MLRIYNQKKKKNNGNSKNYNKEYKRIIVIENKSKCNCFFIKEIMLGRIFLYPTVRVVENSFC